MNDRAKIARSVSRAHVTPLQSVYDRLPVGFALFGTDLRLAAWNARFAALRGYPRKLVKAGTPLESFVRFDAERGEYGSEAGDKVVRGQLALLKRRKRLEREHSLPGGGCVRIVVERIPAGGLLVACEDVTEARDAASRLRQSEERYDFAMRAVNEGLYDWDIVNDTVHYSDRVYQAVGMSPDDYTTAAGWYERIHPDDRTPYLDALRAHFKGETERFELDYRYRARDGSWHWARQHGLAVRNASGRAVRLIGSTGNITELKERERELADQVAEQTAVRELLEAISRSAFELDGVLRTLIESAARLCRADKGFIFRLEGDVYRLAFDYGGVAEAFREFIAQHPICVGRDTLVGRTALTKEVVHIEDVLADAEYRWPQSQRIGGQRTMLGVPIVRDGIVIGVIALWKERVEPFTPAQVGLVKSFASEALIAIENARLFGETKEALEQQTATSEILQVVARSPTELQPVLDAVVKSAAKLCQAHDAHILQIRGDALFITASHGEFPITSPGEPVPISWGLVSGRAVLGRQLVHVPDIASAESQAEFPESARYQQRFGDRTLLAMPLLREGSPIGLILIRRLEVRAFTDKQILLLKTFADQAVIAIENVRLFNETKEALEQQTATAEILRVISESPGDLDPVFREILERATGLCDAHLGIVFRWDGERYHVVATRGEDADAIARWKEAFAAVGRPGPHSGLGRLLVNKQPVHISDILEETAYREGDALRMQTANILKARSFLAVPLLKNEEVIGAVVIYRHEVRPFSARQVDLVRVFADQAVIAIENVRLFNELEARNRELTGALDREKATGEILRVISGSPTEIQPVLDAVAERAGKLCDSPHTNVLLAEGDQLKVMSVYSTESGPKPDRGNFVPISRNYVNGRAILDREVVHIPDVLPLLDTEFPDIRRNQRKFGFRAVLVVPLMREGRAVGTIFIWRREPGLFSDDQVALLKTFADQAVIAIENVRLFNETKEALEQQRATADVLASISGSLTDAQPVFERIVKNVRKLFGTRFAVLQLLRGDMVEMPAVDGDPGFERLRDRYPRLLDDSTVGGLAMLAKETVQFAPVLDNPATPPATVQFARDFGFNSVIFTPMIHEGKVIGAIGAAYPEAKGFDERYVALIRSFADQAVIAIENVRLFNELQARNRELTESLEQQTATAEILRVISNSPTDIMPVLDAVAENAARLCDANDVVVMMKEGDVLRAVKSSGPFGERFGADFTIPITRGSAAGRSVIERATVQVANFELESDDEFPVGREHQRIYGNHGAMATPLLRGDAVLGVIAVLRRDVRPFADRQSALLRTFADQAAIAIANVRLFNETKEALERQTATAEILKVIASSPSDERPVFDAIVAHAGRIAGGCSVNVSRLVGDKLHLAAYTKLSPEADDVLKRAFPVSLTEVRPLAEAVRRKAPFFVGDFEADPDVSRKARELMRARGFRSTVYVPIRHGDLVYGVMHVSKVEPGPFPDHWVNMLRIFANQAVIAIENVRLFNETKEALDHQRASAEILQVISSSVADTRPVFDKILSSCERLFEGKNVGINLVGDDGAVHLAAYHGQADLGRHFPVPLSEASGSGAAILQRRVVHYPDIDAPGVPDYARRGGLAAGNMSILFAPMLWEGRSIGAIWVGRGTVGEFSEKEIALLKTFADQAVIAIQNARLFNEIRDKSHQLEIANQHKSAFLANMSHELRTPLNAVIGFSEMLAARYFGDLTEKQAEYVNDIHGSGKHLLSLINDILDLSKIEAGRMELETAAFDLRAALDNALTLVRERAQRGGVALRLETDPGLGAIDGDERKLKQVVLNLLSNAVKFTPRGGAVSLVARRVDGAAEIAVTDTGAGIAPEDQEAIFEAFRQVGTDATRKREGTGLGLALSRRFVELHGGTIRVESEPGKGSTFTVTLPFGHGE